MEIYINEKPFSISSDKTAFAIRDEFKSDADIVIINGFIISSDKKLKEKDRITLIKRGEIPPKNELEAMLIARHTPGVHAKIKRASVAIAGLGGLGSNVAISLARIGIGKLVLIDFDVVEPSNLNRQQYFLKHIGMPKTEALQEILLDINPFVGLELHKVYLNKSNIPQYLKDVDIIVEAFDNPQCKAELVNEVLKKFSHKPIVAASGMAGYFSNNSIKTKKVMKNLYLIGDEISEAKEGCGLMAPRVAIAANHQANTVLRIVLGERDT